MLYLESSGGFAPWRGETIADVRHPLNIEQLWSDAELALTGLYRPADADPVPADKVASNLHVARVDGVVKFVFDLEDRPEPTLGERKAAVVGQVKAKADAVLQAGFAHDFGGDYGVQHLQLRDADDKANWLTARTGFDDAIAVGAGDMLIDGSFLRTAENVNVPVTPNQGKAILADLRAWGTEVLATGWTKLGALDAATTSEDVEALSAAIDDGWPV